MAWVSKQVQNMVENCQTCLKHEVNRPEPLCPTPFPQRPWQKFGINFFQCQLLDYLIAVDYYLRFTEIAAMNRDKRGSEIVRCLRSMFISKRVGLTMAHYPSTLVSMPNLPMIGDFLFRRAAPSFHDPTGS